MQPVDGSESRLLHSSPSISAKLARNARFRGGPGLESRQWSRISFSAIMIAVDLHRFALDWTTFESVMRNRAKHILGTAFAKWKTFT
jgi:hypothetical protein